MTPVWSGPLQGGITQSLISKSLECPFRFYLYAGLGLEEPRMEEPNLAWGNMGHYGLEHLIKYPTRIKDLNDQEWNTIQGLITDYMKENHPGVPPSFPYSVANMLRLYDDSYKEPGDIWDTEVKFSYPYFTRFGRKVTLRGKVDAICLKKKILVEHKCKGKIDLEQTRAETPFDLQTLMYCYVTGCREVIYDLIRIPEAQWKLPYRNVMETSKSYIDRLFTSAKGSDFPINTYKHLWIQQLRFTIPEERIEHFRQFQLDPLIERICCLYDRFCEPDFDPENVSKYDALFYRTPIRHFDPGKTERYKCNYHSYLTEQLSLDDLVPAKFYSELEE